MAKIQTVCTISEFITGEYRIKNDLKRINRELKNHGVKAILTSIGSGLAIGLTHVGASNTAYAAGPVEYVKGQAKEQIVEAFMPLVDMIQALSYPVALVMLTGGALMFMINRKDQGVSLIMNASIGYILVQMMPLLMKLLVGVGASIG